MGVAPPSCLEDTLEGILVLSAMCLMCRVAGDGAMVLVPHRPLVSAF